jgi:hypothetical protein
VVTGPYQGRTTCATDVLSSDTDPPLPPLARRSDAGCLRVTRAPTDQLEWLCRAAVTATGVNSCGVTMLTDGGQSVTAHSSDPQAQVVEDLQHTLGEGPGVDASNS